MAQWVRADLFILAVGMSLFVATLVGVTALLSIARQWRMWRMQRSGHAHKLTSLDAVFGPPNPVPVSALASPASSLKPDPATERKRWVVMDVTSDQFLIEPGPTRQQRNVQRLIEHLKEEAAKTAAPVSSP